MPRYNPLKLSEYRQMFQPLKALVIGAGAVGSHMIDKLARMGMSVEALDYDVWTDDNTAKCSAIVRNPEDIGRNKAISCCERVRPYLEEGCVSHGIDGSVTMIGPEILRNYDYVIVSVDNFAAKIYLNEIWKLLPADDRPVVLMNGTSHELADSIITDGSAFCLRCVIEESWLEEAHVHTSCADIPVMEINGVKEEIRTSHNASDIAASITEAQIEAHRIYGICNRRLTYFGYPNIGLQESTVRPKRNCPDCQIKPPVDVRYLKGCILDKTLRETFEEIYKSVDGNNVEIAVHSLRLGNRNYNLFVKDDVCHCCGKPIKVMRHNSDICLQDLRCDVCKEKGEKATANIRFGSGDHRHIFIKEDLNHLGDLTLFELGFPLGAHIHVSDSRGFFDVMAGNARKRYVFACLEDCNRIHETDILKRGD